ncbi:MAG: YeeE/YedE thiosulfate transporter family protein [Bdellovibrionaceae bacterium]|jgi:hypothetical protein|nr:YeeE/YedE thiosulfate transporter family protein [Pseudobdellovibrionaceae bacterium]
MIPADWIYALAGGLLIGVSVTLMLWLNGRVTGIAGIIYGLFSGNPKDFWWRVYFIVGLIGGGLLLRGVYTDAFKNIFDFSVTHYALAGFIVGFSTVLGSGCTSGHGVCGMSRLSPRSIVATLTFMASGFLTVYVMRSMGLLG